MPRCYPVIDTRFLYSDYRRTVCCKSPMMKDEIQSVIGTLRQLMQRGFRSWTEFIWIADDYVFSGCLVYVKDLEGCEQFAFDKVGRPIYSIVGITYDKADNYYFPYAKEISAMYKSFITDKYESLPEENSDVFVSEPIELDLIKLTRKKKTIRFLKKQHALEIKPAGYDFLFDDGLQRFMGPRLLYISSLDKKSISCLNFPVEQNGPSFDIVYSKKSFFNHNAVHPGSEFSTKDVEFVFHMDAVLVPDSVNGMSPGTDSHSTDTGVIEETIDADVVNPSNKNICEIERCSECHDLSNEFDKDNQECSDSDLNDQTCVVVNSVSSQELASKGVPQHIASAMEINESSVIEKQYEGERSPQDSSVPYGDTCDSVSTEKVEIKASPHTSDTEKSDDQSKTDR